jgi:inositol transport system ATP-binding protein
VRKLVEQNYLLEMQGISKSFPGVRALHNVDLNIRKGTVHALMGENGAGKSTLMKIIIGMYQPDSGVIKFDGKEVKFSSIHDALAMGISMIHQELNPVPNMTVAENLFLGREINYPNIPLLNHGEMNRKAKELLNNLEITLDPKIEMINLSASYMQMVEIAKAISYNSRLIIMDEPTSAITDREVEHLFKIIERLKADGVSFIYITHKMDEIFRISDEITIFRDGEMIDTMPASTTDQGKLVELMVGRELKHLFPKGEAVIGEELLELRNFTKDKKFYNINFKVHRGEILGIAGLMGAGRTEIIESLFGVNLPDSGEVFVKGRKVDIKEPQDAIKHKIAFLTEDRKLSGLYLPLTVEDNMSVLNLGKYLKFGFIQRKKVLDDCTTMKKDLNIKTPTLSQFIKNLSGGNQQKVLIARWLLIDADILILDEPTRGIDVGAKAEIHKRMSELTNQGKAIIMISSELPEILGMSDRVLVMHEGKITGEFCKGEVSQEDIMRCATGLVS